MVLGISTKELRDYFLVDAVKIAGKTGYGVVEFWVNDLYAAGDKADYAVSLCKGYDVKKCHLMTENLNIV